MDFYEAAPRGEEPQGHERIQAARIRYARKGAEEIQGRTQHQGGKTIAPNSKCRLCEALKKARIPEGRRIPLDKTIRILRRQGISYRQIERGLGISQKTIAKIVKGEAYEGLIEPYNHVHEGQQRTLRQLKIQLRSREAESAFRLPSGLSRLSSFQPLPSHPYQAAYQATPPPWGEGGRASTPTSPEAAGKQLESASQPAYDPLEAAIRYAYEGVTWAQPPLPERDRGRWGQGT